MIHLRYLRAVKTLIARFQLEFTFMFIHHKLELKSLHDALILDSSFEEREHDCESFTFDYF